MFKSTMSFVVIVVVGALIGSFLGKFLAITFPQGQIHDLLATEIAAGLNPTVLDLRVIEITLGCLLRFNVTSVIGMIVSAVTFKTLFH
ncbi:MAG: DUF4321 domain-containing protein [Elusimicrobia bacterium]|nr:DUF4321 domain-containing protein [Elusimicrobiota bacterium]